MVAEIDMPVDHLILLNLPRSLDGRRESSCFDDDDCASTDASRWDGDLRHVFIGLAGDDGRSKRWPPGVNVVAISKGMTRCAGFDALGGLMPWRQQRWWQMKLMAQGEISNAISHANITMLHSIVERRAALRDSKAR